MAGSGLVFGAILGGAVFAAAVWRRRVAEMVPLSVLFLIAHSWLCGQIGLLRFSALVTVFGMIALGVAGLVILLRRKGAREPVWDVSLVCFALGFLWLVYVSAGRMPLEQADFAQWALAPKAMYYTNSLAPSGWAAAAAPALAVFQTIFQTCNALFSSGGGFEGWLLYVAYGTACLALLLPFTHSSYPNRWVRAGYTLLYFLAAVCVPLQFFGLFSALNPDGLLAILAAASLLMAARKKSLPHAFAVGLTLFVLTLVKDAGMFFAAAALAVYAVTLVRSAEYRQANRGLRFWLLAIPALFTLTARLSWWRVSFSLHGATAGVGTLFWQSFAAKQIEVRLGLTAGSATVFSLATVHLSFLALLLALAAATALLIRAFQNRKELRDTRSALWGAAAAAVLYTAGLLPAYWFAVDAADAAKLLNFERLIAVGFAVWMLIAAAAAKEGLESQPRWPWRRHLLVILTCLCVVLTGSGAVSSLTNRDFTADNEKYHTYYAVADAAQTAIPEDARVYLVCQNDDGTAFATLRYALCPRRTNAETTVWLRDPEAKQYAWTYPVAAEAWKAELLAYDYVLVYRADDYLQTAVAAAVTANGILEANTIYRVNKDTGLLEEGTAGE
jgi:hypothetical protein